MDDSVARDDGAVDPATPNFASASPVPAILLCGGRGTRLADAPPSELFGTRDGAIPSTGTETVEKPLVRVNGEPMVDRVVRALRESDAVGTIHAVASPHTPQTLDHLRSVAEQLAAEAAMESDLIVQAGSGTGYVADLQAVLTDLDRPAVTAVADLPLLRPDHVSAAVGESQRRSNGAGQRQLNGAGQRRSADRSITVCVPVSTKRDLGVSVDTTMTIDGTPVAPTGLNVVGQADAHEDVRVVDDPDLAVNVNRPDDLQVARRRS